MKIFLDANVLVSVLCNEYPDFTFCSRVLSLSDNSRFDVYTSPICLAIAFYFAEKKNGNKLAVEKIKVLASKIKFTTVNGEVVKHTVSDKSIHDLEDGFEYYSALLSKCKCIVTSDTNDFYYSKIEVMNAEDFLLKHVLKKQSRKT